jgi:predicted O-methyltransferase YrrM
MGDVRSALAARLTRWAQHLDGGTPSPPLARKDEKQLANLEAEEHFRRLRKACRLRDLPLGAILPGVDRLAVPLGAINAETGHPNHAEMLYVVAAAQQRRARRIFEFGTFMGRTTFHLAAANSDAHVWTLDLPREENPWAFAEHVGSYFTDTPEGARITSIRERSERFSPDALKGSMDFIWVDADHSYAGVKNDTNKALSMLAPGGAIMWHDFSADSLGLAEFFVEFTSHTPLFHIHRTSVLLHLDGVDPLTFTPHPVPFSKSVFKPLPDAPLAEEA